MVDDALKGLNERFNEIYGEDGRKSIPPERLLKALLVQMFYSVRSERLLMEHWSTTCVPVVCGTVCQRAGVASGCVANGK